MRVPQSIEEFLSEPKINIKTHNIEPTIYYLLAEEMQGNSCDRCFAKFCFSNLHIIIRLASITLILL